MIVKMKFISITGPKADIDRVVNTYLSKYEIHLENALTELQTVQNLTPYIQINPYKDTLKLASDYAGMLPVNLQGKTKKLSLEEALSCVQSIDQTLTTLNQEHNRLQEQLKNYKEKAAQNKCPRRTGRRSCSGKIRYHSFHKRIFQICHNILLGSVRNEDG